jgi:phospholipid transport system transporter-binding protein
VSVPADVAATRLPASLTLRDAQPALEALRRSFSASASADGAWRVDATPLEKLDTSALAVLLECARIAAAGGRRLEIVGAPDRLADLAHLYGVDGLLGIAHHANEPVAGLAESRPRETPTVPILR